MGLSFNLEQSPSPVWMDVGAPPAALTDMFQRRRKFARRVIPLSAAIITGVVAGVLANVVDAQLYGGPVVLNLGLSLAVALPVAVAVFFFQWWLLNKVIVNSDLSVRRVGLSDRNLVLELDTGTSVTWELQKVGVSSNASEGGWYGVWYGEGRVTRVFYAPPPVASSIRAAKGGSLPT